MPSAAPSREATLREPHEVIDLYFEPQVDPAAQPHVRNLGAINPRLWMCHTVAWGYSPSEQVTYALTTNSLDIAPAIASLEASNHGSTELRDDQQLVALAELALVHASPRGARYDARGRIGRVAFGSVSIYDAGTQGTAEGFKPSANLLLQSLKVVSESLAHETPVDIKRVQGHLLRGEGSLDENEQAVAKRGRMVAASALVLGLYNLHSPSVSSAQEATPKLAAVPAISLEQIDLGFQMVVGTGSQARDGHQRATA